jgi:3-phenylpropionate/trans-cinnamate dioxygenase ferredoxin component
MVVAAAPALSGRTGKIDTWDMKTSSTDTWIRVCSMEHLAAAKTVCARVADIDIVLMQDDEEIYAFERACPHEQADLSLGRVVAGRLFCPRHLASFSLADGKISAGWPSRDLRCYPVRIADHGVWIDTGPSAPNAA